MQSWIYILLYENAVNIQEQATPGRWTCSPDPVSHSRPQSVPPGTPGIRSESGSIPFVASQSRQILSGPAGKNKSYQSTLKSRDFSAQQA